MTKYICHNCKFFYITYKPNFPYGCKAFAVMSKKVPYLEVKNISGQRKLYSIFFSLINSFSSND